MSGKIAEEIRASTAISGIRASFPLEVYLPVRISAQDAQLLDAAIGGARGETRSEVIRSLIRQLPKLLPSN